MPEHIHLLLTPANEVTLERVVQLIKGGYSHKFGSEFGRKKRSVGERVYGSSDSRLQGL
jgi:putative transposase